MIASVIAETDYGVELLQRVLPPDLKGEVELRSGGGPDGVVSMARTRLVTLRKPTAVVIDAKTSDRQLVGYRRQSMREVVGSVAGDVPIKIIMAVPELEIALFEAPGPLGRLYPDFTSNPLLIELARSNTSQALKTLDPTDDLPAIRKRLLDEIRDDDLPALQQTQPIRELIDFLRGCQGRPVKIRLEIGPGSPSELQSLKEPNGLRALLKAFFEVLTSDNWGPDQVATASSGNTNVYVDPQRFRVHLEPPDTLPSKVVVEVEGEAVAEKTDVRD
jgi:hypothetical protein